MQPCGGLNWIKGRARHIPTQTDTVVRFAPEHVVLFLCLCYLVSKGATKAATPNCVPLGLGTILININNLSNFIV